jgi:hypothetical protein
MIARERSANMTEYFVIDGGMITTICASRAAPEPVDQLVLRNAVAGEDRHHLRSFHERERRTPWIPSP